MLLSGGLDSAILCAELLREYSVVFPLYIRSGLRWENAELASVGRYLAALQSDRLGELVVLHEPVADVYGNHWSTGGAVVPGPDSPDEAVYLPGRNLLLTVKAAVWCRLHGVETLALGSLGSNPFPDSTTDFFEKLEGLINQAMAARLKLIRPYAHLHKTDVLLRGRELPLDLTFSCINPQGGRHCGACNKCTERQNGFREAGIADLTIYAAAPLEREA